MPIRGSGHTKGHAAVKEKLDGNSIRKVENGLAKGKEMLIRDTLCSGLAIRVQGKSAGWYMIERTRRIKIAPFTAYRADGIPYLREVVTRARAIAADGGDPAPFLKEVQLSNSVDEAQAKAEVKSGSWTWEDLRDRYLEYAEKNLARETWQSYRSALGACAGSAYEKDFAGISGKLLTAITTHDLRLIRDSILARGQDETGRQIGMVRQANLTLAGLKAAFKFGSDKEYSESGLTENPAQYVSNAKASGIRIEDIEDSDVDDNKRPLTMREMGMLFHAIEKCENRQLRALLLFHMTNGQRIKSSVSVPKFQIIDAPDGEAFTKVWRLGPDKKKKFRFIPLPPIAAGAADMALEFTREDNRFLFPIQRAQKKGDDMSGYMATSTAQEFFERIRHDPNLPDLKNKDKKKNWPAGPLKHLSWLNSHDLRRCFIAYLQTNWRTYGFEDSLSSDLITHKDEGGGTVSQTIYNRDPNFEEKWKVMSAWNEYLGAAYAYVAEGLSDAEIRERWREHIDKKYVRANGS